MFSEYPDLLSTKQFREILGGIGKNFAYKLLSEQTIKSKKIGRKYFILKSSVIEFLENK